MDVWGPMLQEAGHLVNCHHWELEGRPQACWNVSLKGGFSDSARLIFWDIWGHWGVGNSLLCCVLQSIWQYPPSLPIRCPSTCYTVATTKYIPKHWRMFPRRPNSPWLRTSALGKEVGKQKVSSSMSALRVALFGEVLQEAGELRREVTVFKHTWEGRESLHRSLGNGTAGSLFLFEHKH